MLSQVPIETGQFKKHTQSRRSLDSSAFFCGFFTDLIIWKGWNELCRWAVRLATDWGRKRKKIQEYEKWESITTSLPTVLDYCDFGSHQHWKTATDGKISNGSRVYWKKKVMMMTMTRRWTCKKDDEKGTEREETGVKHTCNNRNAKSAENWTGSKSSCHIAPHVIVMRNPTALFDIPWRPSRLSFRGIENAHRWSCCCCCFGVRICCVWVHSISFDFLLLRLCCSSWSASFVFFRAPQLEICKRDMVRTQRLWQTHYQKNKKIDAHKSQPQSLILPHTNTISISLPQNWRSPWKVARRRGCAIAQ